MPDPTDKPRIIIDSDWKSQAHAEKERLAQQEEARRAAEANARPPVGAAIPGGPAQHRAGAGMPASPGASPAAGAQAEDVPEGLPPPDFRTLVGSLVTQALMYMGAIPDPETGRGIVAPEYARHYIDLLAMLESKTRGNLDAEESTELTEVLHELRMRFVKIAELVTKMEEKRLREEAALLARGGVPPVGPA